MGIYMPILICNQCQNKVQEAHGYQFGDPCPCGLGGFYIRVTTGVERVVSQVPDDSLQAALDRFFELPATFQTQEGTLLTVRRSPGYYFWFGLGVISVFLIGFTAGFFLQGLNPNFL